MLPVFNFPEQRYTRTAVQITKPFVTNFGNFFNILKLKI